MSVRHDIMAQKTIKNLGRKVTKNQIKEKKKKDEREY